MRDEVAQHAWPDGFVGVATPDQTDPLEPAPDPKCPDGAALPRAADRVPVISRHRSGIENSVDSVVHEVGDWIRRSRLWPVTTCSARCCNIMTNWFDGGT